MGALSITGWPTFTDWQLDRGLITPTQARQRQLAWFTIDVVLAMQPIIDAMGALVEAVGAALAPLAAFAAALELTDEPAP